MNKIDEKAPPGWSGTVVAMKNKHKGEIDNPYALANWMKNKGDKSHYKKAKDDDTTKKQKTPKKKDESFSYQSFREYCEARDATIQRP